jgi:hypothetical protein
MRDLLGYLDDFIAILLSVDPKATLPRPPLVNLGDNQSGDLSLETRYPDGSRLYVYLQADCSDEPIRWGDYGFQYVGPDDEPRFRYDNAPHYRELPNFPYHLHLSDGSVLPLGPPTVRVVARAIRWYLDHPGRHWWPDGE